MALLTVFSNNLNSNTGSLTARFTNATAFYIDAPLLNAELEIDVFLQVYFPAESGERVRNLALGKLKDGQIKLNETDTETVTAIPNEFVDSGLEMALFFLASQSIYLDVFVVSPNCTNVDLHDRIEELEKKINDLVNSNNAINTLLDLILNNLGIPTPTIEAGVDNSIFSVEGLVGQWELNNSFVDSSPDGTDNNSASLSGSASFLPNEDFGHVLRLEGDSYLSIPNTEDINLGNHSKRTINVWFKADSTQPRQVIFEEGGIVRGLNIYLDQNAIYFGGWNEPDSESGWKETFFKTSAENGWHLATITLDATLWTMETEPNTFKAYLDGQLVGSGDGSQLWGHADPTAFGAVNGATLFHDGAGSSGSYLIGEIAKPKIFNRALSSTEIQNIYNNFS